MIPMQSRSFHFAIGVALLFVSTSSVRAQMQRDMPAELEGVGISERLNEKLPLSLQFCDSNGDGVEIDQYFGQGRPVILSFTYTNCPMLCHLQLDGLVESLKEISLRPGDDFEIVNVSIDPDETAVRARQTKQKHLKAYGRPDTAGGWHFLVGTEEKIKNLADAAGFQYKWVPERNEYAHAAAAILCTPDGRISRYLYGVRYPARTLRLSLIEASQGQVGSPLDQLLLFCFHYDAATGKYSPLAFRIMQVGCLSTLAVLLAGLVPFWLRHRRPSRTGLAASKPTDKTAPATDDQLACRHS